MAKVNLRSTRTTETDPAKAAAAIVEGLGGARDAKLVTVFASRERDQKALNAALREHLPEGTRLLGATTGGEIDNEGIHFGTVVAAALDGDFEVGIGLGRGLSDDAMAAGSAAMKEACKQLGTTPRDLDTSTHVGVVIDDGFQYKKEELLLGALDKNQGILLVGGGAADTEQDPEKQSSRIHVDGEVVDDAVAICMFPTKAPFAALRHHAYTPTGETMTITKVADDGNRALEIDDQPAAQRYAELLGVSVDDLEFGLPKGFSYKPLALRVGREYFMRAPWKPLPDGSILFANLLEEDATYEVMEFGDMPAMTEEFFAKELPERVKNPQAALFFHCSGRQWVATWTGTEEPLSKAFAAAPTCAGMNVFFEVYCGFHINTTLTALVFGSDE